MYIVTTVLDMDSTVGVIPSKMETMGQERDEVSLLQGK
jgi:hypothetical protein